MAPEEPGMTDGVATPPDGEMVAAVDEQDFPVQDSPARRLARAGGTGGNLLLAGLFAAGIGCVYLLSLRQGPAKVSAEQQAAEIQVDTVLAALGEAPFGAAARQGKAQALVEAFYLQTKQRQVPVGQLWGNPFVYSSSAVFDPGSPADDQAPAAEPAEPEPDNAMDAVKNLSLQSVLVGSRGKTAMISNNLLGEGQTIRGWTVSSIRSNEVVLTHQGRQHVLKMR